MQAGARWGDPFRVGVGGEQLGLFGVGAKGTGDREVEAGLFAGGGGHAVERQRHIGSHRLAHPVGQRAVIAAARAERGLAVGGAQVWGDLRRRPRLYRDRRPVAVLVQPGPDARLPGHPDRHPRRRKPTTGKRHVPRSDRNPVAPPPANRGRARPREIDRQRQMPRIRQPVDQHRRLEQTRIQIAHHLRSRHRRQIRAALMLAPRPQRGPKRKQHHRTDQQQEHDPNQQQRRLAPLLQKPAPRPARHDPPRLRGPRYSSTPPRNKCETKLREVGINSCVPTAERTLRCCAPLSRWVTQRLVLAAPPARASLNELGRLGQEPIKNRSGAAPAVADALAPSRS